MIDPLWGKAIREARLVLAACALVLFAFALLYVWLSSKIELGPLAEILEGLPAPIERLSGIPFADVTTSSGLISVLFVDPILFVTCAIWAIARGSDVVSGEISRGTMEVLLAQPVRRLRILWTQGVITTIGAAVLAVAAVLGTYAGLVAVGWTDRVDIRDFYPAGVDVFALTFCIGGMATLVSACDRYRARAVGIATGIIVVQFVLKMMARMWSSGHFLTYWTIYGAYEPQVMIRDPGTAWTLAAQYAGTLVGLGLVFYTMAAVVFCRRDLPAPL